ncbi:MAG: hypothetical protein M0R68_09615 [Bacteroidetes bacterium]|nr:hypothetical protein [Bacteroidota bacterium]
MFHPGDSIVFYVNWNIITNDSIDIFHCMKYHEEKSCWVMYENGDSHPRKIIER